MDVMPASRRVAQDLYYVINAIKNMNIAQENIYMLLMQGQKLNQLVLNFQIFCSKLNLSVCFVLKRDLHFKSVQTNSITLLNLKVTWLTSVNHFFNNVKISSN